MVDVGKLPRAERLALARLTGLAIRYGRGAGDGDDPVAALREVTTDPRLLGIAAADFLARPPEDRHAAAALALLRHAGADEEVMAAHAVDVRRRLASRAWPPRP